MAVADSADYKRLHRKQIAAFQATELRLRKDRVELEAKQQQLELDVQRTRGVDVAKQDDRCRAVTSCMSVQDMLDDMLE